MILIVYGAVALGVVFAIAAIVVGREARRLDAAPPRATFDVDEAVEWVANHLPFEVSAVLSFADVRRILEWSIDYFRVLGLSDRGPEAPFPADQVVIDREALTAHLHEEADRAGATYTRDQLDAVIDAQFGYFDAIGAIGPEAGPDDLPG